MIQHRGYLGSGLGCRDEPIIVLNAEPLGGVGDTGHYGRYLATGDCGVGVEGALDITSAKNSAMIKTDDFIVVGIGLGYIRRVKGKRLTEPGVWGGTGEEVGHLTTGSVAGVVREGGC